MRIARDNGIVPLLLMAPTSHVPGAEPAYLRGRSLDDLNELVPLHRKYIRAVRDVASTKDVILVDLAVAFDRLPRADLKARYFKKDGIHLQSGEQQENC